MTKGEGGTDYKNKLKQYTRPSGLKAFLMEAIITKTFSGHKSSERVGKKVLKSAKLLMGKAATIFIPNRS